MAHRGSPLATRSRGGVARYYALYELLSGALADGSIPAGQRLPSEPELVARYGLSRTTVRRALERLEAEGRIERRRGSGTYAVGQKRLAPPRLMLESFFEFLPALARISSSTVVRYERVAAPGAIRVLYPQIGQHVYELERVRRQKAGPYEFGLTWIRERIGSELYGPMFRDESLITVLDRHGTPVAAVDQASTAVAADALAARQLEVPLGTPLLRFRAALHDAAGRLLAIHEALIRPDRLRLGATLERVPGQEHLVWRLRPTGVPAPR